MTNNCASCEEARSYKGPGKCGKCPECNHLYVDDAPRYTQMCECEVMPEVKCSDYKGEGDPHD